MNKQNQYTDFPKTNKTISFISSIGAKIIGDRNEFTLENRFFNVACLISIFSASITFLWNNAIYLPIFYNYVFGVFLIGYLFLYYFARFKHKFNSLHYVLLSLLSLSFSWFALEGSMGSLPFLYILAIAGFVMISKSKKHYIYLLLTVLNLILLFTLEKIFYDDLIFQYPNASFKEMDIIFTFSATFLFCFIFISIIKNSYDRENEIIQEQKNELLKLNESKDKFLSIIAHDLRSPFIGMLGLSQLMKEKSPIMSEQEFQEFANELEKTAINTNKLLENLLDWGQIQHGLVSTKRVTINLLPFIFESVKEAELFSIKKDLKIGVDIPETISIYTDKYLLQTILRNLISNAIKFTPRGKKIFISTMVKKDDNILFSIKDQGIGMSKTMIDSLFKMDVKTKRLGTEGESSTGLGLLLCKEFIEKLGGQLWIKSEERKGTEIKFTLPINSTSLTI